MRKLAGNKNYREDIYNINNNITQKYNFQRTLTFKKLDNKSKNKRKSRDYSKREILKDKTNKRSNRRVGKSIGNTKINCNQSKSKGKNNNINSNKNKIEAISKNKKRSKSVVKLVEKNLFEKDDYEEKDDIESVLYGEVRFNKDDDPFDDIDSVARAIDFDFIKVQSKNIFSVEDNEKYNKYSQNFEEIFNKVIITNNQRKSINKNEQNENNENGEKNASNTQSEKTTDSFKKNKINMSFIENQN